MDNLVLLRTTAVLDAALRHAVLAEIRAEGAHRYRLRFDAAERSRTVVVSLRPELPWLARPASRRERGAGGRSDGFAGACRRALEGGVVAAVDKPGSDRVVVVRFGDGRALVAELATHGANLVLLRPGEVVEAAARRPRSSAARLVPGGVYRPRGLPPHLLDPFTASPEAVDACLAGAVESGESVFEALRRRLFGVGTEAARLVADEAAATGRTPGRVLVERLETLVSAEADPVVLAPDDPLDLARRGEFDAGTVRLLPWAPASVEPGLGPVVRSDAAATAGLYHEAVERAAELDLRLSGLSAIVRREVRRLWDLEGRIAGDLAGFEDPERFRRWGEALLAGLSRAVRAGDAVRVPDPYEPDRELLVPAGHGVPLPAVAAACFDRHRRARRGLEAARRRLEQVRARRERLDRLAARLPEARGEDAAAGIEAALREAGIPVGLARRSAGRRGAAPRIEGVRMFTASAGETILVGRSGRSNDRLTFNLAGPEDYWLHARGRRGAHVVLRNAERSRRPRPESLEEAASLAAWFSQARDEAHVEVQWTRRKNVRRIRGAPPGTVTVKRSETVRVRPSRPAGLQGDEP